MLQPHGYHNFAPIIDTLYQLALQSAPALILAYFLCGLISVYLPSAPLRWMQKGKPAKQAMKGMMVGLPLPVCTCGVLPLYRTFINKGVPLSASTAFLIATPELGIDALLLSIPLLWDGNDHDSPSGSGTDCV